MLNCWKSVLFKEPCKVAKYVRTLRADVCGGKAKETKLRSN